MEAAIAMLLIIFIFVAIIAFGKWHELTQDRKLRELVAWSVSTDNHNRCNLPLYAFIGNAQIKLSLPQKYRISGDVERDYTNEIITEYQKDLIQSYLKGHLKLIRSKYEVRGEDYFMFALYAFLSNRQGDYEFLGHNMRKATDLTVVFHKMHYITYMYCRENKILKSLVPERNEKNLKEILDTKQIQVSQY